MDKNQNKFAFHFDCLILQSAKILLKNTLKVYDYLHTFEDIVVLNIFIYS